MHGHGRVVQSLVVGVAKHERHVVNALAIHVIHGIAATSAYTDDLDDAAILFGLTEIEDIYVVVFFHFFVDLLG